MCITQERYSLQRSTLIATPQVKDDKALTLAHQRALNKKLRKKGKTSKKKLKAKKAKPKWN